MNSLVSRGSLFDDFSRTLPRLLCAPAARRQPACPSQIKVDVKETDGGYTVQAEVPVCPGGHPCSIEGNVVSLRAEVRQHDESARVKGVALERYFGSIARSFQLPADIDAAQARPEYDNGVLT